MPTDQDAKNGLGLLNGLNTFNGLRYPIPWLRGSTTNKKLEIEIGEIENEPSVPARSILLLDNSTGYPNSAKILINCLLISNKDGSRWMSNLFHEYVHTSQYSYTLEKSTKHWKDSDIASTEYQFCSEGCAYLLTNIYINKLVTENYLDKILYTKSDVAQRASEYLVSLSPRGAITGKPNSMTLFFYYILEKNGIYLYNKNGDPLNDAKGIEIIRQLWDKVAISTGTDKNTQRVWDAVKSMADANNKPIYLKYFHDFNVDNLIFLKRFKTDVYDGILSKIESLPDCPNAEIKTIPYTDNYTISVDRDDATYYSIKPPKNAKKFECCVFVSLNGLNSSLQAATAIEIFDSKFNKVPLSLIDGKFIYNYYTQNGNSSSEDKDAAPKEIIIVISNIDYKFVKAQALCSCYTSKPDVFLPVYNRQKNIELSNLSGKEYLEMTKGLYKSWKINCDSIDGEICQLIKYYSNPNSIPNPFPSASQPYPPQTSPDPAPQPPIPTPQPPTPPPPGGPVLTKLPQNFINQIIEKFKQLNLNMQRAIVSVHDLRYQFYLRKNYIVSKICEGATSSSVLEQLKRLKEYQDDINTSLNASNDQMISVIGSTVADHAMAYLMNTKSPLNPGWSAEENKVNQALQSVKSKIQNIWKKSPYYLNPSEAGDAFSAVGNPEFEIVFQMAGNKPAPINLPPNLKNESFAKDALYKVSDTIKKFTAVNYKEYLFGDICDPMDWKYFSIIKKHDYREEFMPPQPGSPSYFRELNEIGYFRINAHKYEYENISLLPPDIISAVSRKFECFKRRTIDTIMIQLYKGQFELLSVIKKNIVNISAKDELTTILNCALAEIKSAAVVESNNTLCIGQTTEKINEILMLLNR